MINEKKKKKKRTWRAGRLCDRCEKKKNLRGLVVFVINEKKKKKKLRRLVVFVINEKKKNVEGWSSL